MHGQIDRYPIPSTEEIVKHLTNVPLVQDLAPNIEPGAMPFLQKLHARQRTDLEGEYRSPTLIESSDPSKEILSFETEVALYFDSMADSDRKAASALADQIPSDENMPRVSVCLPVATHEEGRNLYTALEHYLHQSLPPNQFEIFLFLNRPALSADGLPTTDTDTMQALADFKRDYPTALQIKEVSTVLDRPLNLGEIKKLHFDALMLRFARAGVTDPIVIMNDVDMVEAPEKYLEQYVTYFDSSRLVDSVVGEFDLDHGAYVQYPFVHVTNRLHTIRGALNGNSAKRIINSNNSAMRASAYCAIGGNTKMTRSSDSYMGIVNTELRGSLDTVLRPQHPDITTQTSARRVVAAWRHGYAPNEKWRLNLGAHNSEVRGLPDGLSNVDDLVNLGQAEEFNATLAYATNRLIANYESEEDDPIGWDGPVYARAFNLLGITYDLGENNGVPQLYLGDTSNLRKALAIFRQNYLVSKTQPSTQ